jgi:pyridoxine 5-phosphate synthase
MTALSVNLNKLALLRNSRGRNYPDLLDFARRFIALGVQGITIHPRPDERHIKRRDAFELAELLQDYPDVEFNIEGFPSSNFLKLVADTQPDQCTLVPDADDQLTSDHGWDCVGQGEVLKSIIRQVQAEGVRCAVFLDPDIRQAEAVCDLGADRIELYTEMYAATFDTERQASVLKRYSKTAAIVQNSGLGVNAGHDLDLFNLPTFLTIPGILEVSIGHALTVECIEQGMESVIEAYLAICQPGAC